MRTDTGLWRWACTLLVILLIAVTLSACNVTEEAPEEAAWASLTPTHRPAPTRTSEPTQVPAPTDTPEPTQAPAPTDTPVAASRQMSLDDYAAFCAEFDSGETTEGEGEISYGEFSDGLSVLIGFLESVNPPDEVSVWHNTWLASLQELKAAIDEYPGSRNDPIDIERFFSLMVAYHGRLGETIQKLDPAIRDWLVATGCIDEEMAASAFEGWWDEGAEEVEREELTIGAGVEGPLDGAGETDQFLFRAEAGREYLIEAVWEEMSSIRVELSDGMTFSRVRQSNRPPLQLLWTAPESGEYHLNVTSGSGSGSYTVSVSINAQAVNPTGTAAPVPAAAQGVTSTPLASAEQTTSPGPTATLSPTAAPTKAVLSGPANVRYALEGSAIRVTWEVVEGADYYNVYHDGFFDSNCSLDAGGSASFCQEMATDIVDTHYLHTEPDGEENYYWVVACNQEGCSEIDSENPGGPIVDRPGSPQSVTYDWEETAVRVSWEVVEGADYYNVYHDDFFDSSCSLGVGGSASFCEELATDIVETNYLHTEPEGEENYYWVVACNRGGCSEIDSENPARPGEAGAEE